MADVPTFAIWATVSHQTVGVGAAFLSIRPGGSRVNVLESGGAALAGHSVNIMVNDTPARNVSTERQTNR
jgi:hypothetical protein